MGIESAFLLLAMVRPVRFGRFGNIAHSFFLNLSLQISGPV